jgi:hypothetical protein
MDALQFAYWLQGFTELQPDMEAPTPEQWKAIREHLALVFTKVTPSVGPAISSPAVPPLYPPVFGPSPPPVWTGPTTVTC